MYVGELKPETSISGIVLSLDGKRVEVSIESARKLFESLKMLFDPPPKKVMRGVPFNETEGSVTSNG